MFITALVIKAALDCNGYNGKYSGQFCVTALLQTLPASEFVCGIRQQFAGNNVCNPLHSVCCGREPGTTSYFARREPNTTSRFVRREPSTTSHFARREPSTTSRFAKREPSKTHTSREGSLAQRYTSREGSLTQRHTPREVSGSC